MGRSQMSVKTGAECMKFCRWVILIFVVVPSGVGANAEDLVTTSTHRFWVEYRNGDGLEGGWCIAADLRPGDRFLLADGTEAVLRATESADREVEPDDIRPNLQPSTFNFQPVTTYNFEVADTHSYFVGELGVWVHNGCYDITVEDGLRTMVDALKHEGFSELGRNELRTAHLYVHRASSTPDRLKRFALPTYGGKWQAWSLRKREAVLRTLAKKIFTLTEGKTIFRLLKRDTRSRGGRPRKLIAGKSRNAPSDVKVSFGEVSKLRTLMWNEIENGGYMLETFGEAIKKLAPREQELAQRYFVEKRNPSSIALWKSMNYQREEMLKHLMHTGDLIVESGLDASPLNWKLPK